MVQRGGQRQGQFVRIVCINQDSGIHPERKKGAAVHLREMRRSFASLGAEVIAIDEGDGERLRHRLESEWSKGPFDFLYERYALGASAGAEFATDRAIPHVLEVNTPLVEEEERWRGPVAAGVKGLERMVFLNATLITAVSSEVARYVGRHGVDSERIHVFANGVDSERFRPRENDTGLRKELIPEGRFALGFHGRLRGWHGFERLVEASSKMLASGLPIHLLLVGEGDFEDVLGEHVDMEYVTRVPWVDHADIASYVACFDALPLTYHSDAPCYFSPLKLAEAMACGVVPIVPDIGDLTRVVEHERNGLVFDCENLDAFTRCVGRLVENREDHRRLSLGAVETAVSMSWNRIASFILERVAAR